MKKTILFLSMICMIVGIASPVFAAPDKQKTLYVSIDPAPLKAKPAAAAKKVGSAEYASVVLVLKTEKNWAYVQLVDDKSVEGWIPESALTSKKIKDKGKAASADADELALAGKGFNSTIEAVYADQFEVNFSLVDFIETQEADIDSAIGFAQAGQLNDGGAE